MASNAMKTQGCSLRRGDGGVPEVFTAIGEIQSFTGPGGTANEIDVTTLESTAKEYLVGLPNEGDFTFKGNFVPTNAGQIGLRQDRASGVLRNFKLYFTDAGPSTYSFAARVMQFSIDAGVDDAVKLSVSLKISGLGTFA